MPKALENSPSIRQYEVEYVIAFSILSDRRQNTGFGITPIPLSEIVSYLHLYPTNDIDLFVYLICQMDEEYIKLKAK